MTPLAPGATIGVLGGGQLGRMLALPAAELGFDVHVFTPERDSPAARVAARATFAAYDDGAALEAFAGSVDVVTYEFENVPAETARILTGAGALVRPGAAALEVAQDRLAEKRFLESLGVATAPYRAVESARHIESAMAEWGAPAILKTRRLGYDGQGQARLAAPGEAAAAFAALGGRDLILEGFCAFEREASIVAARAQDGAVSFFDLCENAHARGILATTTVPARVPASVEADAQAIARRVLDKLDYIGVLTIEFFVMPDGRLIANEMAPRVHNSGHWTIDACVTSQFEQHIRAVAGWPLGPATRFADVVMTNLIGADAHDWASIAAEPNAHLHLYGKRDARAGRKMGHVTRVTLRGR